MKIKTVKSRPYLTSFASAVVIFIACICALFLWFGQPGSNYVEAITRLALTVFMPALFSGFLAKRASKTWPVYKIVAVYVAAFLALGVLQMLGNHR